MDEGLVKIEDKCDFIFGYLWEFKNFMGLGREIRALEEFEGIDFFHKMCEVAIHKLLVVPKLPKAILDISDIVHSTFFLLVADSGQ